MCRFPHVPLTVMIFLLLPAACGGEGGESSLVADVGADLPEAPEYRFETITDRTLDDVMHVGTFSCRDDALFVSVGAAEDTGIYKLDLDNPDAGWRQLYDQEAALCPTAAALAVALPAGNT